MPSDPTGTHPSGVLVRPAPDFFDDNLCSGGYYFFIRPAAGFQYLSISLFNDAPRGQALKVYGITNGDDSGFGTLMYPLQGGPLGSFVTQCRNVRFDLGAPPGQIYQQLDVVAGIDSPYPRPLPTNVQTLGTPGFSSETIFSPFPMAIIPPGYSLVLANGQASSGTWYATFWYQISNE